jgi:hypothetical protein
LKIVVVLALVAAPSAALAASASGSSSQVWAINCTREQYKPKRIVISCGDGSTWLGQLKWSSWGRRSATGRGKFNAVNCTPDCAAGHAHSYAVKVTLSKPKTCPSQSNPAFKQATVTYTTGPRPKGAPARLTFRCPAGLPGEY